MIFAPIYCTAPHKTVPGWTCGRRLDVDVVAGTMQVENSGKPRPGCIRARCPKCGAKYLVCPVERVA